MNVACILLAAGGSTRLGSPKQLLKYGGSTLLRRAADAALATLCRPVVVVLGAGAESLRAEIAGLDVRIVVNAAWERGMGGSVRLGMTALENEKVDAVLLTLCDQPFVEKASLDRLAHAWVGGQTCSIAAAAYAGTLGVPAVFGREHFAELAALPDAAGARPVLQRHAASVRAVPMPEAATDIDTREQYEQILAGQATAKSSQPDGWLDGALSHDRHLSGDAPAESR